MHAFFSAPLVEQRRKEFFHLLVRRVTVFEVKSILRFKKIEKLKNIEIGRKDLYVFDDWNFDFFLHEYNISIHDMESENVNHKLLLALDSKNWTSRQKVRKRLNRSSKGGWKRLKKGELLFLEYQISISNPFHCI